jgi:hypothetical protein
LPTRAPLQLDVLTRERARGDHLRREAVARQRVDAASGRTPTTTCVLAFLPTSNRRPSGSSDAPCTSGRPHRSSTSAS